MIEFASANRPVIEDERWSNLGGLYREAKAAGLRGLGAAPRDHARTVKRKIEEPKKRAASGPSEQVKAWKAKVDALLAEPVTEPQRHSRPTKAERHFRVADLLRQSGQSQNSQRHEQAGYIAAMDQYIGILARRAVRKLRNPATRFSGSEV